MSSWSEIVNRVPVNLQDIMSEEVSKDTKAEQASRCINTVQSQVEFDISPELQEYREYNENLRKSENLNGTSVSYFNRGVSNNSDCGSEDSEEETELEDTRDRVWDKLEALQIEIYCIPRGYVIKNGRMIAKRDVTMIKREAAKFDSKLCKKLFKHFKVQHEILDNKEYRVTAIDDSTRFLLYKMITTQLIETVTGVVNIGKEKVVLHANSGVQGERAIKVFKTSLTEYAYINDHHRFKDRYGRQNIQKIKHLWVEKEMDNLLRARKAGVLCPEVVGRKKHILITSFIGRNGTPAPKLSDAPMSSLDYINAYHQVVEQMKRLYDGAGLIHIELSEHKILWFDGNCYLYDLSEAAEVTHTRAYHFLFQGCQNITSFFKTKAVPNLRKVYILMDYIRGTCGTLNKEVLQIKSPYTLKEAWKKSIKGELSFVHKI